MTSLFDLSTTQQRLLTEKINFIKSLGLSYAIRFSNGEMIGDLKVVEPKPEKPARKRRPLEFPRGTYTKYLRPFVKDLIIGKTVYIPADKYSLDSLQKSASSMLFSMYGPANVTTNMSREKNELQLTRDH